MFAFLNKIDLPGVNIARETGYWGGVTERVTAAQTLKVGVRQKATLGRFLAYFRICSASLKSGKLPAQRTDGAEGIAANGTSKSHFSRVETARCSVQCSVFAGSIPGTWTCGSDASDGSDADSSGGAANP